MMRNAIDITIIAVYLIGTVIFGCSFFWKGKKKRASVDAPGGTRSCASAR